MHEETVSAYFREHSGVVYRYLAGVYGSESDAEEVTQQAFLNMHVQLLKGRTVSSPRAWALTEGRRLMLERLRRNQVRQTPRKWNTEQKRRFVEAVESLSREEREVMFARAEGLKLAEIGTVLGVTVRRAAEITSDAVRRLREKMPDT